MAFCFRNKHSKTQPPLSFLRSSGPNQETDLLQMALKDSHNQNLLKKEIANRFPQKKPSPDNIIINVRSNHYVEIELDDGVGTVKIGKGRIEIIDNELVELRNVAVKQPLQSCGIGTIILDFLLTACKKSGYCLIKVAPGGGTDYSHEGDTYLIESYGCKIHSRPDDEDLQKARIAFYEKMPLALFQKKAIAYALYACTEILSLGNLRFSDRQQRALEQPK